jgi:hypothetical protein
MVLWILILCRFCVMINISENPMSSPPLLTKNMDELQETAFQWWLLPSVLYSFLPSSLCTLLWFNVLQLSKCYMVSPSLLTVHRSHKFHFHIIHIAADPKIAASDFDIIFATTIGRNEVLSSGILVLQWAGWECTLGVLNHCFVNK